MTRNTHPPVKVAVIRHRRRSDTELFGCGIIGCPNPPSTFERHTWCAALTIKLVGKVQVIFLLGRLPVWQNNLHILAWNRGRYVFLQFGNEFRTSKNFWGHFQHVGLKFLIALPTLGARTSRSLHRGSFIVQSSCLIAQHRHGFKMSWLLATCLANIC